MIDWWNAIWVGAVGGLVMAVMLMMARAMNLSVANMSKYIGCMITGSDKRGATALGLVMHLIISAIIAIIYAWAFAEVWGAATWSFGLISGVVHWAIGGLVVGMMDAMNPCVRDGRIQAFGFYANNYGGIMVLGFLMGHLIFGTIVGWLYNVPG